METPKAMSTHKIHLIAGARPNFMKIAPLFHALKSESWAEPLIVHTGQHYDSSMSDNFFRDLELPEPNYSLGIGSGSHAEQTARMLIAYEKICIDSPPKLVVVVGDVNSTLGACLVAKKLGLQVAHLEAGLRSFDRQMPEEINRILVDSISDILWTPSPDGDMNLLNEGNPGRVKCVGNIMIDSLISILPRINREFAAQEIGISSPYTAVTLHRPGNVDQMNVLGEIVKQLEALAKEMPLIFPTHPRTLNRLKEFNLLTRLKENSNIHLLEPLGYMEFIGLVVGASLILTDSGGLQEEASYLNIPCITVRPSTERPTTIKEGTNLLCDPPSIFEAFEKMLSSPPKKISIPLWDGQTAARIVTDLKDYFQISTSN